MPVLSSLISYRPKRKGKQGPFKISSPFLPTKFPSTVTPPPHPYASPHILDIHDDRAHSGSIPESSSYSPPSASPPRMQLDVNVDPEPLTEWFSSNFLQKSSPVNIKGGGHGVTGATGCGDDDFPEANDHSEESYEGEEVHDTTSAEEALANFQAMDASDFGNLNMPDESQASWRKPAPSPIKIPNSGTRDATVQAIRSAGPSRPVSQISTAASSTISGTTLARALMANTFVLSEFRTSRYRSGISTLTRADSATLPNGDYPPLNSPYRRERFSIGDSLLSPASTHLPPVPDNAEQVYVPPRVSRRSSEPPKRHLSLSGALQHEHEPSTASQGDGDAPSLQRTTEMTPSASSTPQEQAWESEKKVAETRPKSLTSSSTDEPDLERPSRKIRGRGACIEDANTPFVSEASSSGKDIDNVIDYYSFGDTPDSIDGAFRLPFSPITEESSSQLSPPMPYRRDSHSSSKRVVSPGRFFLGASPSATNGGAHVDWTRRDSDLRPTLANLLPIGGESPSSGQISPSSSSPTNRLNSSFATAATSLNVVGNNHLLAPPVSSIFSRQRSGSAPSPIKVVRDPHDIMAYNSTVAPLTGGINDSGTPTSAKSGNIHQTFSETPSAFSAAFSPPPTSSLGSHNSHGHDYMSVAIPQTPLPAFLPQTGGHVQASLAQQLLLTRAATSVHGARHSRQASFTRSKERSKERLGRPNLIPNMVMAVSPSTTQVDDDAASLASSGTGVVAETDPGRVETLEASEESEKVLISRGEPAMVGATTAQLAPSTELEEKSRPTVPKADTGSGSVSHPKAVTPPGSAGHTRLPSTPALSSYSSSYESSIAVSMASPLDSPAPPAAAVMSRSSSRAPSDLSSRSHNAFLDTSKALPRMPTTDEVSLAPQAASLVSRNNTPSSSGIPSSLSSSSAFAQQMDLPMSISESSPAYPSTTIIMTAAASATLSRRPAVISPPMPDTRLPAAQPSTSSLGSTYDYAQAGSPPPYYSVVSSDRTATEAAALHPISSYDRHQLDNPRSSPPNATGLHGISSYGQVPQIGQGHVTTLPTSRRGRTRPPLPAGPRRPSQQFPGAVRERGDSISSVGSTMASTRRPYTNLLPSPRFETPPAKFRGYTMDAAKWTFTSTQLQAIVSRAIRQSSEASSIRLLQLETLDNEIPEELERLDTQRNDVKNKYKSFARRRTNILELLTNSVNGSDSDGPTRAVRLVDDLKDVSATLDRLTEELYTLDEQHAQIIQLCELHSASALAMALRKLNASFLKKFAEAESLRQRVEALEAERDEAWKEAEGLAVDYDDLKTEISPEGTDNRFSRVLAVRKLSARATRAGLRSAGQRSSIASSKTHSISSAITVEIPPVPPIPRRRQRPDDILTNIPLQRTSVGISTGPTPTSETRALMRAQDDLYAMLGIATNDRRLRRSRSVIGIQGKSEQMGSPSYSHYDPSLDSPHTGPLTTGRRASLPGSATQPGTYDAMAADLSILLTSDRPSWI